MSRRARRIVLALAALVIVPAALVACYLPDQFVAEVRINRAGGYAFTYRGELTWMPLYRDVQTGKLTEEEAEAKAELYHRDLARDAAFKRIEHLGNGRFAVEYERKGMLRPSQQVTFVRRNADIIAIKARDDGTVTIRANALSSTHAKRAMELGLNVRGKFHIVTDARVLKHNAQEVRGFRGYDVFVWEVENVMAPAPALVLLREMPGARTNTTQ